MKKLLINKVSKDIVFCADEIVLNQNDNVFEEHYADGDIVQKPMFSVATHDIISVNDVPDDIMFAHYVYKNGTIHKMPYYTLDELVIAAVKKIQDFESKTSADIASLLNTPVEFKAAIELVDLGEKARELGAIAGEFGNVFSNDFVKYTERFESAINSANFKSSYMLIEEMPPVLKQSMSTTTYDAIKNALLSFALTLFQSVANSLQQSSTHIVTEADVNSALDRV